MIYSIIAIVSLSLSNLEHDNSLIPISKTCLRYTAKSTYGIGTQEGNFKKRRKESYYKRDNIVHIFGFKSVEFVISVVECGLYDYSPAHTTHIWSFLDNPTLFAKGPAVAGV